jgi:hypothetical protein
MDGAYATNRRDEKCIQIAAGKPEGKSALGRPCCRWKETLKWILKE